MPTDLQQAVAAVSKLGVLELEAIKSQVIGLLEKRAASEKPDGSTSFLDLPAEIRNRIYRLAAEDESKKFTKIPSMRFDNRQVSVEFSSIYYSSETYLIKWLDEHGEPEPEYWPVLKDDAVKAAVITSGRGEVWTFKGRAEVNAMKMQREEG